MENRPHDLLKMLAVMLTIGILTSLFGAATPVLAHDAHDVIENALTILDTESFYEEENKVNMSDWSGDDAEATTATTTAKPSTTTSDPKPTDPSENWSGGDAEETTTVTASTTGDPKPTEPSWSGDDAEATTATTTAKPSTTTSDPKPTDPSENWSGGDAEETTEKPAATTEPKPVDPDINWSDDDAEEETTTGGVGTETTDPKPVDPNPDVNWSTGDALIENDLAYTVSGGKANVTSVKPSASGTVTVPEKLGGYPVASIANKAFATATDITKVIIESGITSIGEYAFEGCSSLTSITIPKSVTKIGTNAFATCGSFTNVYYRGSEADKASIDIGEPNNRLNSRTWYYNSCIGTAKHSHDDACDTDCNVCGDTRTVKHDYEAATCTKPKTCKVCGYESGEKLGHDYKAATCTKPKTCKVCGYESGSKLGHDYKAATCTKPKTCKVCGYESGSKLGHDYKAATCTKPKTCKVCGYESGSKLGHDYKAATCTKPKTCKVCGYESGSKLGHDYKAATCTKPKTCKVCGYESGEKLGHSYTNSCDSTCNRCDYKRDAGHKYTTKVVTKATTSKSGQTASVCSVCGRTTNEKTVRAIKSVSLSYTSYTYNGNARSPVVTVKDTAGKTLTKNTDYTVTYDSGRKLPGTYNVKVTFKGKYSGTKTLKFKIVMPTTTISKLTAGDNSIKVNVTKKSSVITGYHIQYSTSKSFSSYKTKTLSKYTNTSTTLTGLAHGKTYYVRVRTYISVNGTRYYSAWSSYKYTKTK